MLIRLDSSWNDGWGSCRCGTPSRFLLPSDLYLHNNSELRSWSRLSWAGSSSTPRFLYLKRWAVCFEMRQTETINGGKKWRHADAARQVNKCGLRTCFHSHSAVTAVLRREIRASEIWWSDLQRRRHCMSLLFRRLEFKLQTKRLSLEIYRLLFLVVKQFRHSFRYNLS